jgi:cob(I)alamin adenosyltransferase
MSALKHRLHIYYGYGKGKTTSALGLTLRALGAGKKCALVQFDKGGMHYSERNSLNNLEGLSLHPYGLDRVLGPDTFRFKNEPGDFEEARKGLEKSRELIARDGLFLVVLDEILAAVMCKLLTQEDVMGLVDLYNRDRKCELVLTGHQVWPELLDKADLVTEMRKDKHYFDLKEPPKEGIEF